MKKLKFILLIFIFILAGCKKNSVSLDEFIDIAKFNGYIIENNKTGYETYPNILDVYYAVNRENAYDIQFLKIKDIDYAKKFFLLNVDEIKKNLTSKDYVKSNSSSTYEYYHGENESNYYIVIRSNENIIYIKAPIDYINEIEEFLTDLEIDF
jgi:hypothetical protein